MGLMDVRWTFTAPATNGREAHAPDDACIASGDTGTLRSWIC